MSRLLPLVVLLLAANAYPALAESTVDGKPCNALCRTWLGLSPSEFLGATQRAFESAEPPLRREPHVFVHRETFWSPWHGRGRHAAGPTRVAHIRRPGVAFGVRRIARIAPEPARLEPSSPPAALGPAARKGGYVSGIVAVDYAVPAPLAAGSPAAASPSWEQTALRIFESADEPLPVSASKPASARPRHRR